MYDEEGRFIPTDGADYKLIEESKLEIEIEEIERIEHPVEVPTGLYGDDFDEVIIGPQDDIA